MITSIGAHHRGAVSRIHRCLCSLPRLAESVYVGARLQLQLLLNAPCFLAMKINLSLERSFRESHLSHSILDYLLDHYHRLLRFQHHLAALSFGPASADCEKAYDYSQCRKKPRQQFRQPASCVMSCCWRTIERLLF